MQILIPARDDLSQTAIRATAVHGLRTVQHIRTKVKGHASGTEVEKLVREVIAEHETFAWHFKHVCEKLVLELETIAGAFIEKE